MSFAIKSTSETTLYESKTETTLRGALQEAVNAGAYLNGANLAGAYLNGANLAGAYLTGASLTRASLTRANLADANLTRADLTRADLTGAYLTGANLTGANLTGADLGDQWIIQGQTRSDGHAFFLQRLTADSEPMIKAGCRYFTITQAQEHWERTRKGEKLLGEIREIVRAMVNVMHIRGLK